MRRIVLIAAALVAGAVVLAQSDQYTPQRNNIWLGDTGFDDLKGYKNAIILDTNPQMILAKKQGEARLCPMPANPGGAWPPCWVAAD